MVSRDLKMKGQESVAPRDAGSSIDCYTDNLSLMHNRLVLASLSHHIDYTKIWETHGMVYLFRDMPSLLLPAPTER